jgi:hypothetical protein
MNATHKTANFFLPPIDAFGFGSQNCCQAGVPLSGLPAVSCRDKIEKRSIRRFGRSRCSTDAKRYSLSDVVRAKVCRSFSITRGGQAPSISQTRETYRPAHHLTHLAKPADAAPRVAPFRPAINAPTNMPRPAALAMFSVSCFQFRCGLIQGRTWDAFI